MSGSPEEYWSHNPYAPGVSRPLHLLEMSDFVGAYICALFYGITAALFLKCMSALFGSAKRKQRNLKWRLIYMAHTTIMFTTLTLYTGAYLYYGFIMYIDDREFPGLGVFPLGPLGYLNFTRDKAITFVPLISMASNGYLADGLLLYRCYIIFSASRRAMALPCLIYLASLGMGILYIFQLRSPQDGFWNVAFPPFGVIYAMISLVLNVHITLMIIVRLMLHARMIRNVVGVSTTIGGWHSVIITILIESCALNAVSSLLCFIPWDTTGSWYLTNSTCRVFNAAQVIAPLLIILRVANQTALTSEAISGDISSINFRRKNGSKEGGETSFDGNPVGSVDGRGGTLGERCVEIENVGDKTWTFEKSEDLRGIHLGD